jgi:hypothetical protein
MEKSDWEPDIGATLENCYRQNYSIVSVDLGGRCIIK